MKQPIEFSVVGIVDGQGGTSLITIVGRCGDEPIHLQNVFDAAYAYKYQNVANGAQTAQRIDLKPVHLRVVGIQAYEQDLETLGQGMTGSLRLSGTGIENVTVGCVLGTPFPASIACDASSQFESAI